MHVSPRNNQNHKLTVTSTFLFSNCKHDFCYTMANISPSHVQQLAQLSLLHNNFISFPYFFPSYATCSTNVNRLFHAAIKNLHIKANGIFVFFILLYFTTTLSEGITHTHAILVLRGRIVTLPPRYVRRKIKGEERRCRKVFNFRSLIKAWVES